MKKPIIIIVFTVVLTLTLLATSLNAFAAADVSVSFNFLETAYESYVVHNTSMKPAGDSTKMGYKGFSVPQSGER